MPLRFLSAGFLLCNRLWLTDIRYGPRREPRFSLAFTSRAEVSRVRRSSPPVANSVNYSIAGNITLPACRDSADSASYKRLAAGRPADHRMSISLTNGRKLGVYVTSTNCICTDARCWRSRLKLRTSAPGLSHSEEPRADHSVTARSRSWSGNNVRRVGRNSPPRLDRRLEFGHEPTRDTAHSSSSRFGGFLNDPPQEVSAPPVFATARRI